MFDMEKIVDYLISVLKNIRIRVKVGTLMAFLFCIILFYLISKVLGFQHWATFDQVFFGMFYLSFYGLMVHLFNYLINEKVREIKKKKQKEQRKKEEKEQKEKLKETRLAQAYEIINNYKNIIDSCDVQEKEVLKKFHKCSTLKIDNYNLNICTSLIAKGLDFITILPELYGVQNAVINLDGIKVLNHYFNKT